MSIEAVAWAFKQPVKPAAKKFVLVALADNADTYGICFPSYRHIQKKTGISRRSIIEHCNSLVKDGVIKRAGRIRGDGSDTSNAYRLPIVEGCIDDHPLSSLFKGEGVQISHPPVQEMHPPVQKSHSGGAEVAPREPSFNRQLTEREREPLTRENFLRGVNKGFHDGGFSEEFDHLKESEIQNQAAECWDRWGDDLKGRDPVMILRSWLRKGIALKTVRKAPAEKALQESKPIEPERPLQPWQERIRPKVGDAAFRSWFMDMTLEGDRLIAPTRFHMESVRERFHDEIIAACGDIHYFHQKQEKELCTA